MKKIFMIILFIFSIFVTMFFNYFLGNKDFSFDMDIYPEGYEINTEYGLIKINKENCLKYNWKWLEKDKMCNMRN